MLDLTSYFPTSSLPKIKSCITLIKYWLNDLKPLVELYFNKWHGHYIFIMSQDLHRPQVVEYYRLFNLVKNPEKRLFYIGTNHNITSMGSFSKGEEYTCDIFLFETKNNHYFIAIGENDIYYRYYPETNKINHFRSLSDNNINHAIENLRESLKRLE